MSQADLGTIDGTPVTGTPGTLLATLLNAWRDALHSGHGGAARPAYAAAGMTWVKTVSATAHEVYYYDGAQDILAYTINPTSNRVSFPQTDNIYSNANNAVINPVSTPVNGMSWDRALNRLTLSNDAGGSLLLARHSNDGTVVGFYRNNAQVGGINVTTTTTTYVTSSDYRLKYDVEPIVTFELGGEAIGGPLGKLMRLKPSKYRMYADDGAAIHYGFIAHELQEEIPHAVTGFKDQTEQQVIQIGETEDAETGQMVPVMGTRDIPVIQGVDHSQVMSLAVAAIQQLTLRVLELEARLITEQPE